MERWVRTPMRLRRSVAVALPRSSDFLGRQREFAARDGDLCAAGSRKVQICPGESGYGSVLLRIVGMNPGLSGNVRFGVIRHFGLRGMTEGGSNGGNHIRTDVRRYTSIGTSVARLTVGSGGREQTEEPPLPGRFFAAAEASGSDLRQPGHAAGAPAIFGEPLGELLVGAADGGGEASVVQALEAADEAVGLEGGPEDDHEEEEGDDRCADPGQDEYGVAEFGEVAEDGEFRHRIALSRRTNHAEARPD